MAILNEKDLYVEIMKHFPRGHCQRVENTAGNGVPDINICEMGMEVWVEAKMVIPGGVILRKEQNGWGHRRAAAGGTVVVVAYDKYGLFNCWKFPDIQVSPWHRDDKYVKIENRPALSTDDLRLVKKFLFPGIL